MPMLTVMQTPYNDTPRPLDMPKPSICSERPAKQVHSFQVFSISPSCEAGVKTSLNTTDSQGESNPAFSGEGTELTLSATSLYKNRRQDFRQDLKPAKNSLEFSRSHKSCSRTFICTDCLRFVCSDCHEQHEPLHKILDPKLNAVVSSKIIQGFSLLSRQALKDRFDFSQSLTSELNALTLRQQTGDQEIDIIYDTFITRVNSERARQKEKLSEIIRSHQSDLQVKIDQNRLVLDQYRTTNEQLEKAVKNPGVIKLEDLTKLASEFEPTPPLSLVSPTLLINICLSESETTQLHIPELDMQCNSQANCTPQPDLIEHKGATVELVASIGCRGAAPGEFLLPAGICVDVEGFLFVADEGNSRIQKVDSKGHTVGNFTWSQKGQDKVVITDIAYDAVRKQLLVTRAKSQHGMLQCCTYALVSLEGKEINRFTVPTIAGGLFVSCSPNGAFLISDVINKSLNVIQEGQVSLEITDAEYLKQPAQACFGLNDDILAVDSVRAAVALFDGAGRYVRDITTAENRLKKPCGIAVDRSCALIAVTDWCDDKVLLYSYTGTLLAAVLQFRCPHSVFLTDNHKMVVSDCWNGKVKIFSYKISPAGRERHQTEPLTQQVEITSIEENTRL